MVNGVVFLIARVPQNSLIFKDAYLCFLKKNILIIQRQKVNPFSGVTTNNT